MKVLDLQCQQRHTFEGWFGSEDDFQSQLARGLVECPLCGDAHISKMLSAPRINLGRSRDTNESSLAKEAASTAKPESGNGVSSSNIEASSEAASSASQLPALVQSVMSHDRSPVSVEVAAAMQAAWMQMAQQIMKNTEDVGSDFAEEARKIHYGETHERAIRGQATQDETMELIEEGIDVMPLALPQSLKRPLN